jgi:hypothetical protein
MRAASLSSIPSRFSLLFTCVCASAITLSLPVREAAAQTAADKMNAREFFYRGVKLQEEGKHAEALQEFQRAQQLVNAPTHFVRIAQCHYALGQLVEAVEAYRSAERMQLAPDASPAFVAAKNQAAADRAQIEPRIPTLTISVTPANVSGLSVAVDGQAMAVLLLGAPRRVNPGSHRIVVSAPGYANAEQTITLAEKDTKTVSLTLQSTGVVAPVPVVPPTTAPTTAPATAPAPTPVKPAPALPPPPPAYDANGSSTTATAPNADAPQKPAEPGLAFILGAGVGYMGAGGQYSLNQELKQVASAGASVRFDVGLRFAKILYVGGRFEHGFLSPPESAKVASDIPSDRQAELSASTNSVGATIAWISNPSGFGFYGGIGYGYRWMKTTADISTLAGVPVTPLESSATGGEFMLDLGMTVKPSSTFRLMPMLSIGAGGFSAADGFTLKGPASAPKDSNAFVSLTLAAQFEVARH